jgi:transposase InsO family protein
VDLCSFDEPEGTRYLLLVCDMFSRYVELRVIESKEALVVMDALEDMWFMRYLKRPTKVLTDKGTEFTWLEPFRAQFNFEWSRISPGNPLANGMVERANQTWIDGIRKQRLADSGSSFKQAAIHLRIFRA